MAHSKTQSAVRMLAQIHLQFMEEAAARLNRMVTQSRAEQRIEGLKFLVEKFTFAMGKGVEDCCKSK